jgi:E3 ubiquitin-protein ligase FANCL
VWLIGPHDGGAPGAEPAPAGGAPRVVCSHELLQGLLQAGGAAAAERLAAAADARGVAAELADVTSLAARQLRGGGAGGGGGGGAAPAGSWSAEVLGGLLRDLASAGWRSVQHISGDLSRLTLAIPDRRGRQHAVQVALPPGYPAQPPELQADLPVPIQPPGQPPGQQPGQQGRRESPLLAALRRARAAVEASQEVLDVLQEVDARAWVQAPSDPPRACTSRRISLGRHCSLAFELDPARPAAAPPAEVQFLGEPSLVAPLQQAWHERQALWDAAQPLLANLEALLGLQLPGPHGEEGAGEEEGLSCDCAICYAYLLPDPQRPGHEGAWAGAGARGAAARLPGALRAVRQRRLR